MVLGALERKVLERIYGLTQEIVRWGIHYTNESRGLYKDSDVVMPCRTEVPGTQRMI